MRLSRPKSPQQSRLLALLAILLLACGLILWHAFDQFRTTEQEKHALIKTALDAAAKELSMHLADMRRSISILSDGRRVQIQNLADSPLDQSQYQRLFDHIQQVYPDLFGLMLADHTAPPDPVPELPSAKFPASAKGQSTAKLPGPVGQRAAECALPDLYGRSIVSRHAA
ncbi:MAG: hypothetical protein P8019_09050 [Gammaproteobacteria bacterium]